MEPLLSLFVLWANANFLKSSAFLLFVPASRSSSSLLPAICTSSLHRQNGLPRDSTNMYRHHTVHRRVFCAVIVSLERNSVPDNNILVQIVATQGARAWSKNASVHEQNSFDAQNCCLESSLTGRNNGTLSSSCERCHVNRARTAKEQNMPQVIKTSNNPSFHIHVAYRLRIWAFECTWTGSSSKHRT